MKQDQAETPSQHSIDDSKAPKRVEIVLKTVSKEVSNVLGSYLKTAWSWLPTPAQKAVAGVERRIASIPSIYFDPAIHVNRLERGTIVISLDFEMAWGWQHRVAPAIDFVSRGLWERAQVPRILKSLDCYRIPTTWFTVGHLFLDHCDRGRDGRAHTLIARLPPGSYDSYRYQAGDWFQNDPCTDFRRGPAWYAPDLVEMILRSSVSHELACHTFSHIYLGAPCTVNVADCELNASIDAMAGLGVKSDSFSFPRGSEGNFDSIVRSGFRIVRAFTGQRAILSLPVLRDDGLWAVHCGTTIDRGARWSHEERCSRLKSFVDAAAQQQLAFHMFLHPSLSTDDMDRIFVPFLAYCAHQRDRGLIDVVTVRDLVRNTRNRGGFHCAGKPIDGSHTKSIIDYSAE